MTVFLVVALSVVGACAVVAFLISLAIGAKNGWRYSTARRLQGIAVVCALLGVSMAVLAR